MDKPQQPSSFQQLEKVESNLVPKVTLVRFADWFLDSLVKVPMPQ